MDNFEEEGNYYDNEGLAVEAEDVCAFGVE